MTAMLAHNRLCRFFEAQAAASAAVAAGSSGAASAAVAAGPSGAASAAVAADPSGGPATVAAEQATEAAPKSDREFVASEKPRGDKERKQEPHETKKTQAEDREHTAGAAFVRLGASSKSKARRGGKRDILRGESKPTTESGVGRSCGQRGARGGHRDTKEGTESQESNTR